jgi:hypothetical protein
VLQVQVLREREQQVLRVRLLFQEQLWQLRVLQE